MVRANDDNTDSPEATSDTNKKKREPGRLTPMPDWLMHWWTPLLLAGILLAAGCFLASIWRMPLRPVSWWKINLYWPPSWPFNYHWPSKDAMALCATIAGAGFAFSAWQQRSHDNAVNAKQAQAAVERDDYWKRREHIYQLLGSKNPGLRLSAVALLAELADSAAHSSFLNKTEKQQLQRHIIDTLCLQVRHEGLNQANEGTDEEHANIQTAIFEIIFKRINSLSHQQQHADWSDEEIPLDHCNIFRPIQIYKVSSNARISFHQTTFHGDLTIRSSKLLNMEWEKAIFKQHLYVIESSTIKLTTPPNSIRQALFSKSTIQPPVGKDIEIALSPRVEYIRFVECSFIKHKCYCMNDCSCKTQHNDETCSCKSSTHCPCTVACKWASVNITTLNEHAEASTHTADLTITGCNLAAIKTTLSAIRATIDISRNHIHDQILLIAPSDFINKIKHAEDPPNDTHITIQWNRLNARTLSKPIQIEVQSNEPISNHVTILFNMICDPNNTDIFAIIKHDTDPNAPNHFTFDQVTEGDAVPRLIYPWKTGTGTDW